MSDISVNKKRIVKNTMYMYLRMFFTIIIGFYTSRVVLNTLGVSDYGIYNAVGGIVSLFVFLNTAMTQATQRFLSYELGRGSVGEIQKIFSMCLNVHLIISIIIIFLSEVVGLWLLYNKMVIPIERLDVAFWVFQFSIFSAVLNIIIVPYSASIYSNEKFNIYAVIQIVSAILKLVFVVSLQFISFDKLLTFSVSVFIVMLTTFLLYQIYCIRSFRECHYLFEWDKDVFKSIMGYTSFSLLGDVSNTLADQGVNLLLNMFFGPAVNASRGIAMQVRGIVGNFVGNFQGASIPQIVKLYSAGEREQMISLVLKTSKISFFLYYVIVAPVLLEMYTLLKLWLGQVPEYMVEFSRLSLLIILIQSFGGTLLFLIQATGKIKKYQMFSFIFNLFVFPLTYVLFKYGFNPITPFVLTIVMKFFVDVCVIYFAKALADFPVKDYICQVIVKDVLIAVFGAILPVFLHVIMPQSILRTFVVGIVSVIYISFIIYCIGFNSHERQWIKKMIINKI